MNEQENLDKELIPETVPYARFKEVNDKKKELETQLATLNKRFTSLEAESVDLKKAAETSELKLNREIIAARYKLPEALVNRLIGATLEELDEDAKNLVKLIEPENPGVNDIPRKGTDAKVPKDEKEILTDALRNLTPKG